MLYHPKVRSDLIPCPPTYNTKYGYLSWEAYSNISYYTRLLPPVPEDCPLPMGTKGETLHFAPQEFMSRWRHVSSRCRQTSSSWSQSVGRAFLQETDLQAGPQGNQPNVCLHGSTLHPPVLQDQLWHSKRLHQGSGTRGETQQPYLHSCLHRHLFTVEIMCPYVSYSPTGRCKQYIRRRSQPTVSPSSSYGWKVEISGMKQQLRLFCSTASNDVFHHLQQALTFSY